MTSRPPKPPIRLTPFGRDIATLALALLILGLGLGATAVFTAVVVTR